MANPFDSTFFKFLVGFVLLLLVSFSIIYLAAKYKDNPQNQAAAGQSK